MSFENIPDIPYDQIVAFRDKALKQDWPINKLIKVVSASLACTKEEVLPTLLEHVEEDIILSEV